MHKHLRAQFGDDLVKPSDILELNEMIVPTLTLDFETCTTFA